jgi:hypothetical protein
VTIENLEHIALQSVFKLLSQPMNLLDLQPLISAQLVTSSEQAVEHLAPMVRTELMRQFEL